MPGQSAVPPRSSARERDARTAARSRWRSPAEWRPRSASLGRDEIDEPREGRERSRRAGGVHAPSLAHAPGRPCRSATASRPTARRTRPSVMPAAARASGEMRPWVVVAGWVMVLFTSPRLAVIEMSRVASMRRQAAAPSALHLERKHRAARLLLALGERVLRMRFEARDSARARRAAASRASCAISSAAARLRAHAQLERLEALQDHPGVERRERRSRRCAGTGQTCSIDEPSSRRSRRRARGPGRRGAWSPNGSRGRRRARAAAAAIGVQNTLSTASSAPRFFATSASAGDIGDLGQRIGRRLEEEQLRRSAARALRHSSTRVGETNVVWMPKRPKMLPKSCTVAPNTAFEQTMWSPALQERHRGGEDRRHARGGGDAGFGAFERGEAILEHRHGGIGEARVDDALLGCRAKRAAACAALSNTKLEVRNSASECSWNSLRAWPARTPSVASSYSLAIKKPGLCAKRTGFLSARFSGICYAPASCGSNRREKRTISGVPGSDPAGRCLVVARVAARRRAGSRSRAGSRW